MLCCSHGCSSLHTVYALHNYSQSVTNNLVSVAVLFVFRPSTQNHLLFHMLSTNCATEHHFIIWMHGNVKQLKPFLLLLLLLRLPFSCRCCCWYYLPLWCDNLGAEDGQQYCCWLCAGYLADCRRHHCFAWWHFGCSAWRPLTIYTHTHTV